MKNIIQFLIALAFSMCALAEDAPTYLYRGEVAGVMCSACSGRVKAALSQIQGVKEVKITLGKDGAPPQLKVVSTSPDLTQEAAVKALGEDAKMYHITGFKRAEP
jgi:copper chaperone CopZ